MCRLPFWRNHHNTVAFTVVQTFDRRWPWSSLTSFLKPLLRIFLFRVRASPTKRRNTWSTPDFPWPPRCPKKGDLMIFFVVSALIWYPNTMIKIIQVTVSCQFFFWMTLKSSSSSRQQCPLYINTAGYCCSDRQLLLFCGWQVLLRRCPCIVPIAVFSLGDIVSSIA